MENQRELMKKDCRSEGRIEPEREREGERLQECLERRRTGPQQYTTKEGEGWGGKKRTDEI